MVAEIPLEVESTPEATLLVEVPIVRPQAKSYRAGFGDVHDIVVTIT